MITRRDFIKRTGVWAYFSMGLLPAAPAYRFEPEGSGDGKEVVILGAGLAGMTAAYELSKVGYSCTLVDGRGRGGGRCWSVRKGSRSVEAGPGQQVAGFDEGQYFNAGPS